MKFRFTDWLKKKYIRSTADKGDKDYRMAAGILEAWTSIIGNVVLFGVKLTAGIMISSISVVADAFHTLSDVLSSLVVMIGFRLAGKGPDKEHPYGHGRMETIATLIISILLIITGAEFVKSSVERWLHPVTVGGGWWVAALLIVSAVFKEWMARFAFSLGEDIHSSTLKADAWHHRSDAIAAVLVAVGNLAAVRGFFWVDPLLGIAVSILIMYTGWELARSSGNRLIGVSPSDEVIEKIHRCAKSVEAVEDIHDVQVHDYGYHREISLHVEVDQSLSLVNAHEVADRVEKELGGLLQAEVVVHVDPCLGDGENSR